MRALTLCLLSSLTLTAIPMSQAWAQEAEDELPAIDWNLVSIPDSKALIATADFDTGLVLSTRCMDGVFETSIHGLRDATEITRTIQVTINDSAPYDALWLTGTNPDTAFSLYPSRFARNLAKGGRLQLRLPATDTQPPMRYIVDLPPSASAVEQTLVACGENLSSNRYENNESETHFSPRIRWEQQPRPEFPPAIRGGRYSNFGFVALNCLTQVSGRPRDCEIESEYPAGFGFGRAAVIATEKAQVAAVDPADPLQDGTPFVFTLRFSMANTQDANRLGSSTGSGTARRRAIDSSIKLPEE